MELELWENLGDVLLDSELPSFSLSVLMAGKIDGMEIGESGFVPFLIQPKLPDSELADGKTECSTSDSLLSSLIVLPRSELLATNSATKHYEIQKCLKLKLYSIQSLKFFLFDSKFFETYLNQLGASSYWYWTEKFWEIESERITYEKFGSFSEDTFSWTFAFLSAWLTRPRAKFTFQEVVSLR